MLSNAIFLGWQYYDYAIWRELFSPPCLRIQGEDALIVTEEKDY